MNPKQQPELLAPAGNLESLHAAIVAGADAVYLGLDEYNARRNADNFPLDKLGEACDYAHLRGASVYVAMNIEILPKEFDRAMEFARQAYLAGADALIVQDLGLAAELTNALPHFPLHASTQMNTHNAAGVEAAARLGVRRITLARELSLEEVLELARIAASFGIETECFAHGALCVCYSGQCLMSSMIGSRSANRGLCAQACRLPYELHGANGGEALETPGEHLLSPRDLCTIGMIGELARTGVSSLKIEGRMKSADYVHEVVSVYREVIDSEEPATEQQHARLDEAFSRGFTTAYLTSERGNDMMSYGRPNNRGVFAGRVVRILEGHAEVRFDIAVHENDIVEFWTNNGHFAATVPTSGTPGSLVRVPIDRRTSKGDRVFRVRNAATTYSDNPFAPRIPLTGQVTLRKESPAHIRFRTESGAQAEAWGEVVEAARTMPVSEHDVRKHVNRLGQTPFSLEDGSLSVDLSEGAGIGFSQLHRLRSEALDRLTDELLSPYRNRKASAIRFSPGKRNERTSAFSVTAWATNPNHARVAKRAGADLVYVPLLNFRRGQAQQEGARQKQAEQAGYPKQCVMALPTIDHDPIAGTREEGTTFDLWDYVRPGKTVFADNLGDAVRALSEGARVEVGSHIPATNAASLSFLADLGVSRVWLSPELTLGQIADLAEHSPVELGIFVKGAQELMITEHCLLMSQGPCDEHCESCSRRDEARFLIDRKGFKFPIVSDMLGRSHLYNGIELDIVPNLPDLIDIGISAFMVDTTLMDKKAAQAAVERVVRARDLALLEHRSVGKRQNTTTGHLFRGVS